MKLNIENYFRTIAQTNGTIFKFEKPSNGRKYKNDMLGFNFETNQTIGIVTNKPFIVSVSIFTFVASITRLMLKIKMFNKIFVRHSK